MTQLDHSQKVLFLSSTENLYIPGTIINRASCPQSHYIEAQGKWYHRTRENIRTIQQDIFEYTVSQLESQIPKLNNIPIPSLSARAHPHTLPQPICPQTQSMCICSNQQPNAQATSAKKLLAKSPSIAH